MSVWICVIFFLLIWKEGFLLSYLLYTQKYFSSVGSLIQDEICRCRRDECEFSLWWWEDKTVGDSPYVSLKIVRGARTEAVVPRRRAILATAIRDPILVRKRFPSRCIRLAGWKVFLRAVHAFDVEPLRDGGFLSTELESEYLSRPLAKRLRNDEDPSWIPDIRRGGWRSGIPLTDFSAAEPFRRNAPTSRQIPAMASVRDLKVFEDEPLDHRLRCMHMTATLQPPLRYCSRFNVRYSNNERRLLKATERASDGCRRTKVNKREKFKRCRRPFGIA